MTIINSKVLNAILLRVNNFDIWRHNLYFKVDFFSEDLG